VGAVMAKQNFKKDELKSFESSLFGSNHHVCFAYVGFLSGHAGLFCGYVGLFCRHVGLFSRFLGLFCGFIGLFCGFIGLFGRHTALFCGCAGSALLRDTHRALLRIFRALLSTYRALLRTNAKFVSTVLFPTQGPCRVALIGKSALLFPEKSPVSSAKELYNLNSISAKEPCDFCKRVL